MEDSGLKEQTNSIAIEKVYKQADRIDRRVQDIKVLMYHRLLRDDEVGTNTHWTGVHYRDFEEHLKILENFNYTPITFKDLKLHLNGDIELPRKPVIITFDDGYRDFYELGYPLLKEYGMRAVIFTLGDRSITENIWDDPAEVTPAPLMSDEEIKELHDFGFEIGAHTFTHPKLTELPKEELYKEIYQSKIVLEHLLGEEVITFCYPYGLQNTPVRNMVRNCGFDFACSVYTGPFKFGNSFLNIRRITIKNGMGSLNFAIRMLTPYEYIELGGSKLKRKLRGKRSSNN